MSQQNQQIQLKNLDTQVHHHSLHRGSLGFYHYYSIIVIVEILYKAVPITLQFDGIDSFYNNDINKPVTNIDPDEITVYSENEQLSDEIKKVWSEWREEEDNLSEIDRAVFEKILDFIGEEENYYRNYQDEMRFEISEKGILMSRGLPIGYIKEGVEIDEIDSSTFQNFITSEEEFEWSMCVD